MAFVKIDKSPRGLFMPGEAAIRMGAHNQSKQGTTRGVYFSLTEKVIEQVGWNILPSEDSKRKSVLIDVQEGVGEDAGFLLLMESADSKGYACGTTTDHARSYSMSVSVVKLQHYVLNEVPVPSHDVEFTVDAKEKTILIQCPDWMRYNPLSYDDPKEVKKPSPPTKAAVAGGKKEDAKVPVVILPPTRKERRQVVSQVARSMQ